MIYDWTLLRKIDSLFYHTQRFFSEQEVERLDISFEQLRRVEAESLLIETIREMVRSENNEGIGLNPGKATHYLLTVMDKQERTPVGTKRWGFEVYGEKVIVATPAPVEQIPQVIANGELSFFIRVKED